MHRTLQIIFLIRGGVERKMALFHLTIFSGMNRKKVVFLVISINPSQCFGLVLRIQACRATLAPDIAAFKYQNSYQHNPSIRTPSTLGK